MSDTPRVDKEAFFPHDSKYRVCDDDFARQLERELNAATSEVDRLRKANLQLREGAEEQKQRIKRLEEFVDQLTNPKFTRDDLPKEALLQRIKRLEEAGDALANHHLLVVTTYDKAKTHVADWNKTKEEKP